MLQNATYNFDEFTRSVEPLKCFSIYAYLLSTGKTNSSATSFNMKNHSTQKKLRDKKGSRAKKSGCKNIAANSQ